MAFKFHTAKQAALNSAAALILLQPIFPYAAPLSISDQPVFLQSDLPPNFVVTLDDSGSMQFAWTPDAVCTAAGYTTTTRSRRFRSAWFNSQYYDPRIYYPSPVDKDGVPLTTSFDTAYHNGFDQARGSINLNNATYRVWATYNPALAIPGSFVTAGGCSDTGNFYAENPADFESGGNSTDKQKARRAAQKPFYYVRDTTLSGCDADNLADEDCYTRVWVSATSGKDLGGENPWNSKVGIDERQNFANWYSFYRVRNLSAISGASRAFVALEPTVRVAWQALNTCNQFNGDCKGWDAVSVDNRIRSFEGAQRENFYKWLFRLPATGGTPLRTALERAGEYYKTSGDTSPYAENPNPPEGKSAGTDKWGCRLNYALAMTDGYWNSADPSAGNADGTATTLPDGKSYAPMRPFNGATSNTLADVAFKYWATDLRDLANNVPKYIVDQSGDEYWNPKNDPATWQHMVTFTVGFGLKRGIASSSPALTWDSNTYNGSYEALKSGTDWPTPAGDSNNNISDLWHAAINSRGQFFPADEPDELRAAFESVVNRIQEKPTTFSAVTTSSGKLTEGEQLFQPLYNPGAWSGDLRRIKLGADGSLPAQESGLYPAVWSAAETLAPKTVKNPKGFVDHSTRNIVTSVSGTSTPFDTTLADKDFLKVLPGDSAELVNARLNWIRGDATNEGPSTDFKLRIRKTTKLGDIVNSSPVLVGTPSGYVDDASFFEYVANNCSSTGPGCSATRAPVVYVGANDGMLHAFDAVSGKEIFAYIPEAVHERLKFLPSTGYSHKFYVDGTPVVGNVKIEGTWTTVLAGGLGAGGRGIYALNVTKPDDLISSPTKALIWEFNSSNDGDLGYTFGEPLVRTTISGPAVIFGNGYNSTNGKAVLFIKSLTDGVVTKIDTGVADGNGLSAPAAADTNGDGKVDTVYAGDLKGNVWRFDLVGNKAKKVYAAADQSITTAPALIFHPRGGIMVLVGTGQAVQASDLVLSKDGNGNDITPKMTIYGLWDTLTTFTSHPTGVPITSTTNLEKREFIELNDGSSTYRTLKGNTISWYDTANPKGMLGWYVDLPDPGERIVFSPVVRSGAAWFVSSVASTDTCEQAGSSWLMKFNALNGLPIPNTFKSGSDALGAKQSSGVGNFNISQSGCKNGVCTGETFSKSDGSTTKLETTGTSATILPGRVNWRDITQ